MNMALMIGGAAICLASNAIMITIPTRTPMARRFATAIGVWTIGVVLMLAGTLEVIA